MTTKRQATPAPPSFLTDAPASARVDMRTRAELVADRLAELASSREPGTRLGSRDDLRTWSGVSVGTFNEALRVLQSHQQIVVRRGPGGGVFAPDESPIARLRSKVVGLEETDTTLEELTQISVALGPMLLTGVAENATPEQIEGLDRQRRVMREAAERHDDGAFLNASLGFFSLIVDASTSPVLRSFYGILLSARSLKLAEAHGRQSPPTPDQAEQHLDDVGRLLDAIRAGDSDAVLAALATGDPNRLFQELAAEAPAPLDRRNV